MHTPCRRRQPRYACYASQYGAGTDKNGSGNALFAAMPSCYSTAAPHIYHFRRLPCYNAGHFAAALVLMLRKYHFSTWRRWNERRFRARLGFLAFISWYADAFHGYYITSTFSLSLGALFYYQKALTILPFDDVGFWVMPRGALRQLAVLIIIGLCYFQ